MTEEAYRQVAGEFHARIETISNAVDTMAPALEAVAHLAVETAMTDGRLLLCAAQADEGIAMHLTRALRRPDEGLPPLPALLLCGDYRDTKTSSAWLDLRALSRDGDLLLCLDSDSASELPIASAEFARERNLRFASLSYQSADDSRLWVPITGDTPALRQELLLMAGHVVLGQIREQLMGT